MKKESSEFRITRKNTQELIGENSSTLRSTDRRRLEPSITKTPSQTTIKSTGSLIKVSSIGDTNFMESIKNKSHKQGPNSLTDRQLGLNQNYLGPNNDVGANFKADIERILKASGVMEMKSKVKSGVTSRTNLGSTITALNLGANQKHKYTKSGPESIV